MSLRSSLRSLLAPHLKPHPALWNTAKSLDGGLERARHSAARVLPMLIRPEPRRLQIAITANCNLRCVGCHYGRDFMRGEQLGLPLVRQLLDDAKDVGFWDVRLYGGEPLLHPDLPEMVRHSVALGLETFVTTNGMLLDRTFPALFDAGLRRLTIGYYGTDADYDAYVQRPDRFARLERNVAEIRDRYGSDVNIQINWLLSRRSCTEQALDAAIAFAERYDARIQVDLIHYSLPYFSEGPDRELQFRPEDRPAVEKLVSLLLARAEANPSRFLQDSTGLRSIPDWLILGPDMRVPCDSHQMLWVGADGSVQQCYVTFPLGNLHHQSLKDIVFTDQHKLAAKDSFRLACPNCHCNYHDRVAKHAPSRAKYAK